MQKGSSKAESLEHMRDRGQRLEWKEAKLDRQEGYTLHGLVGSVESQGISWRQALKTHQVGFSHRPVYEHSAPLES